MLSVPLVYSPILNLTLVNSLVFLDNFVVNVKFVGACDKIHNDRLRDKYQKSPDKYKYSYEDDFYAYLNKLVADLARKIRHGNGRLTTQLADDKAAEIRKEEREERMVLLDVKIKELLQSIEEAGEEGRVQEATDLQSEVDKLQAELADLKEVRKHR